MSGIPDYALNTTFDFKFSTRAFATGVPTTLIGTPVVDIYEDNSVTQITGAETLTVDFDGLAGFHNLRIVATSGNGFGSGQSYSAVLIAGTVAGTSVANETLLNFTIEKQSALRPTIAGNTFDVNATGEGAPDWANVGGQGATVNLSATTLNLVNTTTNNTDLVSAADNADAVWDEDATAHQTTGTFGQAIGDPVADTATIYQKTADILADTAEIGVAGAGLTAIDLPNQTMDIVGDITGNLSGSVGSVTTAVSVDTLAANTITAASINAAAFTAAKFDTDAIDANALAADAVTEIRDAILPVQNVALSNIEFLFVSSGDHVTPVVGAGTLAATRSIDGAAFGAGTGTIAEVGNGIYQYDASAADMNGGIITFRFTAASGTPAAPDDSFLTIFTGAGV